VEALISINNHLRQPEAAVGILTLAQQHLHMELKVRLRTLQTMLNLPWSEAAVGILTLAQQHLHMELKVRSGLVLNLWSE